MKHTVTKVHRASLCEFPAQIYIWHQPTLPMHSTMTQPPAAHHTPQTDHKQCMHPHPTPWMPQGHAATSCPNSAQHTLGSPWSSSIWSTHTQQQTHQIVSCVKCLHERVSHMENRHKFCLQAHPSCRCMNSDVCGVCHTSSPPLDPGIPDLTLLNLSHFHPTPLDTNL